ncbi:MAG: dipeptidase [[Clostridium] scindens]
MNELGMIIDLSHASDGTSRDVLEYAAKGPVVASHSNCRAIADHPRNLSDEMIRKLANAGGVAGLNFYGPFLGNDEESRIDQMVAHILHMIRTGGSEFPAIGTDFDGFDGMTVGGYVPDISQMEKLWDALKKAGVGERQLDKLWGGNGADFKLHIERDKGGPLGLRTARLLYIGILFGIISGSFQLPASSARGPLAAVRTD